MIRPITHRARRAACAALRRCTRKPRSRSRAGCRRRTTSPSGKPNWAAEVEKATGGRVKFQLLPKHPPAAPGTFDAVRDGLVDLSYVTASYTPARHILPLMAELPGAGDTAEINSVAFSRIHWKHFHKRRRVQGRQAARRLDPRPGPDVHQEADQVARRLPEPEDPHRRRHLGRGDRARSAARRSSSRRPSPTSCSTPAWPTACSSRSSRSSRSSSTR